MYELQNKMCKHQHNITMRLTENCLWKQQPATSYSITWLGGKRSLATHPHSDHDLWL